MELTAQFLPVGLASALALSDSVAACTNSAWSTHSGPVGRRSLSRSRRHFPQAVLDTRSCRIELALIASLVVMWSVPEVRFWLLTALASHAVMRLWSAFDFIPKALAFERADAAALSEADARNWDAAKHAALSARSDHLRRPCSWRS